MGCLKLDSWVEGKCRVQDIIIAWLRWTSKQLLLQLQSSTYKIIHCFCSFVHNLFSTIFLGPYTQYVLFYIRRCSEALSTTLLLWKSEHATWHPPKENKHNYREGHLSVVIITTLILILKRCISDIKKKKRIILVMWWQKTTCNSLDS